MTKLTRRQKRELLSKEDDVILVKQWQQQRDEDALDELVKRGMPLINHFARKGYRRHPHIPIDDLKQGCIETFIASLDKYDASYNVKLVTYMTYWMNASLIRQTSNDKTVRPRGKFHKSFIRLALRHELQKHPEWHQPLSKIFKEVSKKMKVPLSEVEYAFQKDFTISSLNASVNLNGSTETFLDLLKDHTSVDPLVELHQRDLEQSLEFSLSFLRPRHAEVLRRRFGIGNNGKEEFQQEIADSMGVTRQRIHTLEKEALEQLKLIFKRQRLAGNDISEHLKM